MMPFFVMGLFITVLFSGLSIDIGLLESEKTRMQVAADAAAIAEEMRFERVDQYDGTDGTDGYATATLYGYTNGVNNTTVTSTNGLYTAAAATAGDYQGHFDVVQMIITRQVQTFFMGIFNGGTVSLTATGIAAPPPCLFFLGTKNLVPYNVTLQNTASIGQSYAKCPAYVAGGLFVPSGAWWQTFQNYLTGSPVATLQFGRVKSGKVFNSPVRADPLASVAQPSIGACNYNNLVSLNPPSTITLNPGVYCGSVNLGIVTPAITLLNGHVALNPGLYIIRGGINLSHATITGNGGVTFFFTNVPGTSSYGTVSVDLFSTTTLSAASGATLGTQPGGAAGAIEGILFFCDRNWVNSSWQDFRFSGSSNLKGIFYMPSTGLALADGNSFCTGYCAIVADNLYLANFAFYLTGTDFTLYPGTNPLRTNSVLVQ